jgi:hypothetical protein
MVVVVVIVVVERLLRGDNRRDLSVDHQLGE